MPPGVHLLDAPHPWHSAIKQALVVLSWFENLEERFIPPKRIWTDPKRLKKHMERVKKLRDDEAKGRSSEIEEYDGEMVENPAVSMFIVGDD